MSEALSKRELANKLLMSTESLRWGAIFVYDGLPTELLEANVLGPGNLQFPKSRQTSSVDQYGSSMHLRRRNDGSIVIKKTVRIDQPDRGTKHGRPADVDIGPILARVRGGAK